MKITMGAHRTRRAEVLSTAFRLALLVDRKTLGELSRLAARRLRATSETSADDESFSTSQRVGLLNCTKGKPRRPHRPWSTTYSGPTIDKTPVPGR